jgi:hypothetical protein
VKTGLLLTSLVLCACLGAVIWMGAAQWRQSETQRRAIATATPKLTPVPPPAAPPPAEPTAVVYADVAEKNLFSKDRNPNVVIEQKPVEEKKMPPLPSLYGVMGMPSGAQALMSENRGDSGHPVRAGETIGEFKVLALDTQNITFGWNGKEISRKVDDLIDRSGPPAGQGPAVAAAPAARANTPAPAPPPPAAPSVHTARHGSIQVGTSQEPAYNCFGDDNSPAGTVDEGFRKTVLPSPFGSLCKWVAVR